MEIYENEAEKKPNFINFDKVNGEIKNEITSDEDAKRIKRRIMKNLLIIGFAWMFNFTAYSSIANLQSSLNTVDGLGTISLSIIYASLIVSCLFLPTVLIQKIGIKWTIILSLLSYILYIAANIFPRYYTLLPAAVLLGCKYQ
jgi:hypothetical protein